MFVLGNAEKNLLGMKNVKNKYYDENYNIDLSNNNDSHSIIVNAAINNKRVLDVGCGVGFIGKKLKEINDCIVDGIEIDSEAIKIASKYYDEVFEMSIEDFADNKYKDFFKNNNKYDCIIMADVIEHLCDPAECIFQLSKKLKLNGKLIISTPNIANVNIISHLIDGKFNYNTTGILDKTHIKLFTESSFYDFIMNINNNYNEKFGVKVIGKTYAKDESQNDDLLYEHLGNELYVFQNIFEISREYKSDIIKNSNNTYFEINKEYNNQKFIIQDLLKKEEIYKNKIECNKIKIANLLVYNKEYKDKIIELSNQVLDYDKALHRVLNSKSWKITRPFRAIIRFFGGSKK